MVQASICFIVSVFNKKKLVFCSFGELVFYCSLSFGEYEAPHPRGGKKSGYVGFFHWIWCWWRKDRALQKVRVRSSGQVGLGGGWSPPQQDLYRCHYLLYLDDRWGPESLHWYPTIYLKSSQWRNGLSVPPVLGTCYSTKVPTTVRRRAKGNDWGVL